MKIIRQLILVLASLAVFSSCVEEEKLVATAIMTDKPSLEFGIEDTLAVALTVYADAPWTVECANWITVEPATGDAGETVVTVMAQPNMRDGLADRPRKESITFVGRDIYANATVSILQNGDKYRDLVEGTLADAFAQPVETFVGVKDVQVVALTSDGFIVKDETAHSYVAAEQEVAVGDKGNVYSYVSTFNGLPSLKDTDRVKVSSNSAVDYSAAKDITSELQAYEASQIELISITGKLVSKKIELYYAEGEARPLEPDSVKVELLNTHETLKLNDFDGWLVEAKGYTVGSATGVVYVVPVALNGIKSLETIYFSDDFSWLAPWSKVDAVGKDDQSTSVDNVWKMSSSQEFFDKFNEIGYQYLWSTVGDKEFKLGPEQAPNGGVGKDGSMYICKDYLKFGQSSYNGAIRLPALSSIEGEVNITIDFDWCWQVTGANKADIMTVTVESNNGKFEQTGTPVSQKLESAQSIVDGESHLAWQHVSVTLTGATAETVLTIRPTNADPSKSNPERSQNRWYLDNIKIIENTGSVSVAEPTEAEVSISMENNIIFEAAQTDPITFEFESDQEATLTAGADWMYFLDTDDKEVSSLTIAASTPTTVKVGAKEHTESEPRTTEITIESGLTVETVPVKQMSPGQKVEPFVSIVGGNGTKVTSDEGTLNITVQSNVEFEVESDVAWATVEAVPATKATVDFTPYVIKYEANTVPEARTAHIRVFNAQKNLESVYTIEQAAFEVGVFFQDDFTWVAPFVDADIAQGRTQGDSMLDNAQYIVSSSYGLEGFEQKLAELGYEALFPESKAIYVMKGNYLKFSKGKNTNGIRLPKTNFYGESTVALSFDWGINIGANGPDPVELEVVIEGNGTIGGQQKSAPIKHTAGDWEWQTETIVISGVDNDTRISIRPTAFTGVVDASGNYRWFLDNVKLAKSDAPVGGTLHTVFPFPYDPTFDASKVENPTNWNLAEGWILSEDGKSKLSAHNPDGSALKVTYKYEASSDEGVTKDHVRVLATGLAKDAYWLFEVPVVDMPAGKYNIKYTQSSSNTGANYFLVEVSVDGQNWTAVDSKTSTETYKDGSEPREVTYTYALNKLGANIANMAYKVDLTYSAPALPGSNTLYIRAKVADDMEYRATKPLASGGTNRIWGPCEITFAE